MAVLFVDLDRFKSVNDTYGHFVGDQLLVAVAARITEALRPGDTLARLSGDEFVILCEDLDNTTSAAMIAVRITDALQAPFDLADRTVPITASVGIAFTGICDDAERVLRDADAAMYRAKNLGGDQHQTIDLREQHLAATRESLQRDIGSALTGDQFRTVYQPIVDAASGRVTGIEALLRWEHPNRGIVSPSLIVPFAEQTGLINDIGRWVLTQACTDRHRWASGEDVNLQLTVNVSVVQLMKLGFVDTVATILATTGTCPERLTLEITESVFITDPSRALVVLNNLKAIGVALALDDFGTGYTSMRCLSQFPFDVVKIDRALVSDLNEHENSLGIVRAIVSMARSMNMIVIAEGVETAEQYRLVTDLGSNFCQGFYFARPMSALNFDTLIQHTGADGTHLPLTPVA